MAFSLGEYQDIFLEEADEQLQDKMENLLQGIRDRTLSINSEIIDVIFKCFDEINSVIESVSEGIEPKQDLTWIMTKIDSLNKSNDQLNQPVQINKTKTTEKKTQLDIPKTVFTVEELKNIKYQMDIGQECKQVTILIESDAQMKWVKAHLVIANIQKIAEILKVIPDEDELTDETIKDGFKIIISTNESYKNIVKVCDIDLIYKIEIRDLNFEKKDEKQLLKFGAINSFNVGIDDIEIIKPKQSAEISNVEEEIVEEVHIEDKEHEKKLAPVLKTVKVSVEKLDQLLNNVAELVIANSGYFRIYDEIRKMNEGKGLASEFKNKMEQMARIAKDLQTGIMKTRMVPIGQVFNRYNRLVRDLTKECGKKVNFVITGEDTELDKKVIDVIGEPLLHLIRNAIDHGVELPEERKKAGKDVESQVTLNAYQGGNQIFVEVSDDGKGLNVKDIKKKVIEKGMSTAEALANMDEHDICNFIFAPGFSTASQITDLSGRGVGMNVVQQTVNELNGSVSIETELGMGTRFLLSFPLTLAIIPAIMIKIQSEKYAIPLPDVIETIKISQKEITTIEGHEVINLRNEILSLLRLSAFVGIESNLKENEKIPVVVVGFGKRKIGLIVDSLEGKQEIVIKSLEQNYRTVEGLAGASILGDGSIALILDINSMINKVIIDQDRFANVKKNTLKTNEVDYEKIIPENIKEVKKTENIQEKKEIQLEELSFEQNESEQIVQEDYNEEIIEEIDEQDLQFLDEKVEIQEEATSIEVEVEKEKNMVSNPYDGETSPVAMAKQENEEVDERVSEALKNFKDELKDNIKSTLSSVDENNANSELSISKKDLDSFQLLANIGATNAAESLSLILNKRIDLSIPEVSIKKTEKIPEYLGNMDSVHVGVLLPIIGDVKGTLLFILDEEIAFHMVDLLYGIEAGKTQELNEDGISALKEITNIIGSGVLNVFAEKTGLLIKPNVPSIVHDYMQSIIDSILIMHNMENENTIVMDTSFYFEDDRVVGNLLVLPDTNSMKKIFEGIVANA